MAVEASSHVRNSYSDRLGFCIQPASTPAIDHRLRGVSINRRPLRRLGANGHYAGH